MAQIEKMIRMVFASHPQEKEFLFTSDGQAFKDKSDAANHARSLENKAVILITRSQLSGDLILPTPAAAVATPDLSGGAKNDFQKKGVKGSQSEMGDEVLENLVRKYEMLSGKKAGNMKAETLTQKVAELESAAAQGAPIAIGVNESSKDDSAKEVENAPATETGEADKANPKID